MNLIFARVENNGKSATLGLGYQISDFNRIFIVKNEYNDINDYHHTITNHVLDAILK